jgi:hypothetical protein
MNITKCICAFILSLLFITGCGLSSEEIAQRTATAETATASLWTATPTATPTATMTPTPTHTPTPTQTHITSIPTLPPTPILTIPSLTPIPKGETIIVTSAEDSGPGTLRQGLGEANIGDTITFDPAVFPPDVPVKISLTSPLPELYRGYLTIDASNADVILDGTQIDHPLANGLMISSDGNTIQGLQIVGFPRMGILMYGAAQKNTIGGNRDIGSGPLGQGNLISSNGENGIMLADQGTSFNLIIGNFIGVDVSGTQDLGNKWGGLHINGASDNQVSNNLVSGNDGHGMDICCTGTSNNTISGNLIGTDVSGVAGLGNAGNGIELHEGASQNFIGPDNIIAYNDRAGVGLWDPSSKNNTITDNKIFKNGADGIYLGNGGDSLPRAPLILDFDLGTGTMEGIVCANCAVMVFSVNEDQGLVYEGKTIADKSGVFSYKKGSALVGPQLVTTATDTEGNTSKFSLTTSGTHKTAILQDGNNQPRTQLQIKSSRDLIDNRIGSLCSTPWCTPETDAAEFNEKYFNRGMKGILRLSLNEMEAETPVDWSGNEFSISPDDDAWITLVSQNIEVAYSLNFWDKANYPSALEGITSRFKTEQEIQRYLDYVSFIVHNFKGRIHYYEIWNEPDNGDPIQHIEIADYINLVRRTIPVIRGIDPEAKIIVGSILSADPSTRPEGQIFLNNLFKSDVMPFVDVISLHTLPGASPQYGNVWEPGASPHDNVRDYYYAYPSLVQQIKDVAYENGFRGEILSDELQWRTQLGPIDAWPWIYTEIVAAKYYARSIMTNLGMNVRVGVMSDPEFKVITFAIVNLSTLMDTAIPSNHAIDIQSEAERIVSYEFTLPNGDRLLAIWSDGVAVDDDPGIASTLILPGYGDQTVTGIDVLYGFEQELVSSNENGDLVIHDFLLKDYPIFIRLSK